MSGRRRAVTASSSAIPVPPRRTRRRWGLRTIRARIALILAVPTVLLVLVAAFGVLGQLGVSRDADATAQNVELVLAAQELVHSLQRERGLSVGLVGGESRYRGPLDQIRKESNAARTALDRLLAATDSPDSARIRSSLSRLEQLTITRSAVDAGQATKSGVFTFYTSSIAVLGEAMFAGGVGQDDPLLRTGLAALRALSAGKEATGQERAALNGVFSTGFFSKGEYALVSEIRAARLAGFEEFSRLATPAWTQAFSTAQRTPQATTMLALEQRALAAPAARRLNVVPENWWNAATGFIDGLYGVQLEVAEDVRARAAEVKTRARDTLLLYGGGAAVMLLMAFGLGLMTFRSIIRPLRMLTGEAHDAAEQRLPRAVARIQAADDPGGVVLEHSRSTLAQRDDEFAEVATALDHLQETAVRLAVEQAVMRRNTAESLANLGRRNQNLVRRQLGFISSLEKEETDPNQLANLFELDHLATRMRRNAESLLVLVGEHSPRRWSGSISVGDILRSAFAEVEDYRRVVLRRVDEGMVRGAVAAEISHLLAELVENALSFSPPDQEVEVSARSTGSEYHIAIVDQGIGMSAEALAEANARLRGQQSFLMQPTRDLGHYVVGRLAARLDVRVWLHDSPLNGVTARIVLPGSMLDLPERAKPEPELVGAGVAAERAPSGGATRPVPRPEPSSPPPASAGRTAGGLAKRPPRTPGVHRGRRTAPEPPREPAPPPADRTPDEVQTMLNNFRSGFQRAEQRDTEPGRES
ncbi:nitrate- and nitrite sensing domain-containing protein [Actinocorallia sp. B10E7]|uniref:sensor histidine kinase n=1 Tax=Actinocorallia sp. B10E7 TaxID=3153558 RepID=UPI00325E72A9